MFHRTALLGRNALRQTQQMAVRHSHDGGVPGAVSFFHIFF